MFIIRTTTFKATFVVFEKQATKDRSKLSQLY